MAERLARALAQYGQCHQDPRNVATHVAGIPMIVLAVEILLSRPAIPVGALMVTPACVASLLASMFYLRLDARFGAFMAVLLALGAWAGARIAALPTAEWLGAGAGLFVVGWALQLLGHRWEGRRPAFVDDLVGLLVGPLYLVAEAAFRLGLRREVEVAVERMRQAAP